MKRIIALALSISIFGVVSAQPGRWDNNRNSDNGNDKNNRYETPRQQDDHWDNQRNTTGYDPGYNHYDDHRMSDRERQQEMDRINRDYDRRVAEYRNDHRMSPRDRDYQIQVVERERNSRLKSFAGGLLLGGVLGAIISH